MKKKIGFLLAFIVVMTVMVNINYSKSDSNLTKLLENVEALATDSEAGGSGVRGTCEDKSGVCEKKCPGNGCKKKVSGTSGRKGPLTNIKGTCTCGYVF